MCFSLKTTCKALMRGVGMTEPSTEGILNIELVGGVNDGANFLYTLYGNGSISNKVERAFTEWESWPIEA